MSGIGIADKPFRCSWCGTEVTLPHSRDECAASLKKQRDSLGAFIRQAMVYGLQRYTAEEVYDFLVANGVSGKVTREDREGRGVVYDDGK